MASTSDAPGRCRRPAVRCTRRAAAPGSTRILAQTSLATDDVFRDDHAIHQRATTTGSVSKGYVANLTIGV
jgi:hypothetical protein